MTHRSREIADSAPLLDRRDELLARWAADGVLYFSQVLDPEAVAGVREAYLGQLRTLGLTPADETRAIWSHPSFQRVIRAFLGE